MQPHNETAAMDTLANGDMAVPAYPGFRAFVAPPEMGFGDRVLTAFTRYPSGRTFFNATMLCKAGREFNIEKTGDDAEKKIVFWERKHEDLIAAIADAVASSHCTQDHLAPNDLIDFTNAHKQTGPHECRGTFMDNALFHPLLAYAFDSTAHRYFPELESIRVNVAHPKRRRQQEREIKLRMAQELNGKSEVSTPDGQIDVLTTSEVIEIKHVKDWKNAYGQIVMYSEYHPDLQKRIHLFGDAPLSVYEHATRRLVDHGIRVTWEPAVGQFELIKMETNTTMDNYSHIHCVGSENIQLDMSFAEREHRFKERESELEERVAFWKRTAAHLQDVAATNAKRMKYTDAVANAMPENPDHSALDDEGNKYLRDRLYNFPRAVSAAMYEGDTKGVSSFVKDYVSDVLNIEVRGMGDTVGVIGADMVIQRAIKHRSAVGWGKAVLFTEITARQAFTVIGSTAEWMRLNVPGSAVVCEFNHQANVFRNRYEGLTPSSMEPRLVLELSKKTGETKQ
ncbi:hypothetical protein GHT06_003826 [Daphnia sinensis]|uniref:Uncharacterized protein n=1 Tax=Daphnia sinensis TaxID=1820382 RepID=A0AAD5KSX9_9CRUS|nr:hypothetical protein GHT06_003826 [Daphnia sinensis]